MIHRPSMFSNLESFLELKEFILLKCMTNCPIIGDSDVGVIVVLVTYFEC